jgi:hypothetical protein
MSRADSIATADTVNRTHPGRAEFVEIEAADHLLAVHNKLADSAIPKILAWLHKQI